MKVNFFSQSLTKTALGTLFATASMTVIGSADAATFNLSFTKLSGLTGGSPAGTAVYYADLSTLPLSAIRSIQFTDNSVGLGGAGGQFSGFDLDAIKLSNTLATDAANAVSLAGLNVFNFTSAGTTFTPGTQRFPADPKLFGTTGAGNVVDNSVATLASFDGNSTTAIPGAFGFLSMGDGGTLSFDLTSAVPTSNLYLYIGEVGDNGEVSAASITVSDQTKDVPEPSSVISLIALGSLGSLVLRKRKQVEV